MRVAANKCKDHLKAHGYAKVEAPGDDAMPEPRGAPAPMPMTRRESVLARAGAAELEQLVRTLRGSLRKNRRYVLLEHKENAEIARLVGRPPATVNSQLLACKAAASPADT